MFATNLFTAQGVATGLRQAGKTGKVKMVGFDAGPDQIKQLKAGQVQALVAQKPYDIGVPGRRAGRRRADRQAGQEEHRDESLVVTKANLSQPGVKKYIYKASC